MGTKPLIHHALDEAEWAGFDRVVIVIAPAKSLIRTYFEDGEALELAQRLNLEFVDQPEPNGVGEAVLMAARHLKMASCAVLLPDDVVLEHRHWDSLFSLHHSSGASCLCIRAVTVGDSNRFGMVGYEVVGSRLRVTELAEKPAAEDSPSNLAIFGRYVLTAAVLEALETLCSRRGRISEVSLTEGLAEVVKRDPGVFAVPFQGEIFDAGTPTAYAQSLVRYERAARLRATAEKAPD